MALNKAIHTDFGIDANYWNIGAVQEDFKGQGAQITLYGYLDAAARLAGKQPLAATQLTLVGADYVADADRATLYGVIKTKEGFEGSSDV